MHSTPGSRRFCVFRPDAKKVLIMTTVRAAITQVAWTGDKESMIQRHE
jgi:hypothetical protein